MARLTEITSPTNPRIKAVVRLREHRHRRKTGTFIAEGRREIQRALAAGLVVREVYFCPALLGEADPQDVASDLGLEPGAGGFTVTAAVFRKIAYLREPEGVLAVMDQPGWSLTALPEPGPASLYLVAVETEKPGNLGAMVRTAQAAGCDAVLAAGAPVDVMNPNAIRASTGAVFAMPTVSAPARACIDWLTKRKVRLAAAIAQEHATPCDRFDWAGPVAIVIGPEDRGLDEPWRQAAFTSGGGAVTIPMHGTLVDSLNASNAAAILLYEALRQRG